MDGSFFSSLGAMIASIGFGYLAIVFFVLAGMNAWCGWNDPVRYEMNRTTAQKVRRFNRGEISRTELGREEKAGDVRIGLIHENGKISRRATLTRAAIRQGWR